MRHLRDDTDPLCVTGIGIDVKSFLWVTMKESQSQSNS